MYDPFYLCVFSFVVLTLFVIFMYVGENFIWSVK